LVIGKWIREVGINERKQKEAGKQRSGSAVNLRRLKDENRG
jgi:hypothetical protein